MLFWGLSNLMNYTTLSSNYDGAASEQKILEEQKKYGPIDYDAPPPSTPNGWTDNLGAKLGIGLAVVVFVLLSALGDSLPSGSPTAEKSSLVEKKQFIKEESSRLQAQVQEFEDVLKKSPEDRTTLEGVAIIYAELGECDKAEQYLSKKSPGDVDVLRLLADVQNGKGDYDANISSFRAAIKASDMKQSLPLLQGLTDTLLAAKKPSELVFVGISLVPGGELSQVVLHELYELKSFPLKLVDDLRYGMRPLSPSRLESLLIPSYAWIDE